MSTHDLLSKAIEIRNVATAVAQPGLREELLSIALKFERLALNAEPKDGAAAAHLPSKRDAARGDRHA